MDRRYPCIAQRRVRSAKPHRGYLARKAFASENSSRSSGVFKCSRRWATVAPVRQLLRRWHLHSCVRYRATLNRTRAQPRHLAQGTSADRAHVFCFAEGFFVQRTQRSRKHLRHMAHPGTQLIMPGCLEIERTSPDTLHPGPPFSSEWVRLVLGIRREQPHRILK